MLHTKPKKIAVLTGAGISAESGIPTFRGSDGLWEGHRIEDVASPEGYRKNPDLVQDFYNQRRKNIRMAQPNAAHLALKELENAYELVIITQNIDDLHERAGSSHIIHLHGEIMKARSLKTGSIYNLTEEQHIVQGDYCPQGGQLRPHIVWFGESVPLLEDAAQHVSQSDIIIIIGTSGVVYPAAGLIHYAPPHADIYIINPDMPEESYLNPRLKLIEQVASVGVRQLVNQLLNHYA